FVEEFAPADESSNKTPCRIDIAREPTMGLDLILGVVILVAAYRGWSQGFISQVVRITSFVACVYIADRVRNLARPYATPYLVNVPADLVDPVLWWVSAVVTFVVLVGVASLIVKMTRRPMIPGIPDSDRNDRFAGLMLGALKGLVVAAVIAAA